MRNPSFYHPARLGNLGLMLAGSALPLLLLACGGADTSYIPPIQISISPKSTSTHTHGQVSFTAKVTGGTNAAVNWSVQGGAANGSMAQDGSYTAPNTGGSFTVIATSQEDTTKTDQATVTVKPVNVSIDPSNVSVIPNGTKSFTAQVTEAQDKSVTWTLAGSGSLNSQGVYLAPSSEGGPYSLTATSVADPSKSATALVWVKDVAISLNPSSAMVRPGGTQIFSATVTGTSDTGVDWKLIPSSGAGYLSPEGVYAAPNQPGGPYTIMATSRAVPTRFATASVTVTQPSISLSPSSAVLQPGTSQQFMASVTGMLDTTVNWSVLPAGGSGGSITSSGFYTAPLLAPSQTIQVIATSKTDPNVSSSAPVTLSAIEISLSPKEPKIALGGNQQFTANVKGTANTNVSWSVIPAGTGGSINSQGVYTAPNTPGDYTILATCHADPSRYDSTTAHVGVTSVRLDPPVTSMLVGQSQTFTATVTGASDTSVNWIITPSVSGSHFVQNGNYAQFTAPAPGSYTIVATSRADASKSATARAEVSPSTVTVSLTPLGPLKMAPTTTRVFNAAVTDPNNPNVNPEVRWILTPASAGTLNVSGNTAVLVAGTPTDSNPLTVQIQATAVADSRAFRVVTVDIGQPPTVTKLPMDQSVTEGQPGIFTVVASGTPPFTYQWYRDAAPVPGGDKSFYITPATTLSDNGSTYTVVVGNDYGAAPATPAARLSVVPPTAVPNFTQQPASQTVLSPSPATFTTSVDGYPVPTLQWTKNGSPIAGATASMYSTPPTTPSDSGSIFSVTATNNVGSSTSLPAVLTVNSSPSLTSHPQSQTVVAPAPASFSVSASGSTPLSYQWMRNGVAIPGAQSAHYSLGSTSLSDHNARFSATVSNAFGGATSQEAILSVDALPTITVQPTDQSVSVGAAANFSVTATGQPSPTFQWSRNGTSISGATSSTYTLSPVAMTDDGAQMTVAVANRVGSVTSNPARLTVNTPPSIVTHPQAPATPVIAPAGFSLTVVANGSAPLNYQWYRNGVAIPGATAANYNLSTTSTSDHGAVFHVIVTNAFGSATSQTTTLQVDAPPSITLHPTSQSVLPGSSVSFTVAATGLPTPTIQWQRDGANISGATNTSYSIAAVVVGDNNASFRAVFSNRAGSVTSNAAILTVSQAPSITSHPSNQFVTAPATATFSVSATGAATLLYQWYVNGSAIPSATSPSYTTPATTVGDDNGSYYARVTNSYGSASSNPATLTVYQLPSISTQPANQTATAGGSATFTVVATGKPTPAYQWQRGGIDLPGETGSSLTVHNLTVANDNGASFRVVVSNVAGRVTSTAATLTVNP